MMTYVSALTPVRERLIWASFHCVIGTLLLLLTVAGYLWKQDVVRSESELRTYWAELRTGKPFQLNEATLAVYNSTSLTSERFIRLHENWVQWMAGFLYAPLRRTQDTDLLINGQNAECSERSQILKSIAEEFGYQCRFVGLGGHVVLEVAIDGDWQVADPEFGLTYPVSISRLAAESQQAAVIDALRSRNVNEEQIGNYLRILQSEDDNVRLPIGESISPRLKHMEDACNWLAWIIPIACYVSACGYFFSARTGSYQSE